MTTEQTRVAPRHAQPARPPRPRGAPPTRARQVHVRRRSFWRELPFLLVIAFGLAFAVKSLVVQPFFIPSGSMQETLLIGDRVLVNKIVYHTRPIQRGDVVVFNGVDSFTPEGSVTADPGVVSKALGWVGGLVGLGPSDERDFVKRVIGVGGDHVRCCDEQGRITVNGIALDEQSYLYPGNPPSSVAFDVVVPAGKLWVMGDHRDASSDSRDHLGDPGGGFVPVDRVIGRAFAVVWPIGDAQILQIPSTFEQPGLAP